VGWRLFELRTPVPPLPWPLTGVLEPTGSLTVGSQGPAAVLLDDGRVLAMTDLMRNGEMDSEIWDPSTGVFESVGPMVKAREQPRTVVLADGRVLIIGGLEQGPSAELFDPVTATFSPTANDPTTIYATAVRLRDGRVLLSGGLANVPADESGGRPVAGTAEIFDPITNTFSSVGPMRNPRVYHRLELLPDGRVLVLGGVTDPIRQGLEEHVEIFDPSTGLFTPSERTFSSALGNPITDLGGNRLLVLRQPGWGQFPDRSLPMTAVVYDLASGGETTVAAIPANAPVHDVRALVRLTDARVLLVGSDKASSKFGPFGFTTRGWYGVLDITTGALVQVLVRDAADGTVLALPDLRILILGGTIVHDCVFQGAAGKCSDASSGVDILR